VRRLFPDLEEVVILAATFFNECEDVHGGDWA
jgi:hypothetical protein